MSCNLFLVTAPGNERDVLWSLSSDPYPFVPYLVEVQTIVPLDGVVWAMAEVNSGGALPSLGGQEGGLEPPLVVRQHLEPPRKFIVLTQAGAEVLLKLRPVDLLRQLLVENRGPEAEPVKLFFEAQKEEQACATSLILASFNPAVVSTPYPHASPQQQNVSLNTTTADILHGAMQFSHRHNGLYLYVGRIVRPVWNLRILCSTVSRDDCVWVLEHLQALRTFLDKNTQFSISGVTNIQLQNTMLRRITQDPFESPAAHRTSQRNMEQEAQLEEKRSLDSLKAFVAHTCEVLGMWRILCEHQFHIIASVLAKELQNQLQQMTFRNLILEGHELCSALISSLINRYLNDNASVDAISGKLREVCPTLYRSEDAACSKANEMLLSAKSIQNPEEKETKLRAALQLCQSVAPALNLPLICHWFNVSHFYVGILELALTCAAKLDPQNVALHFYKNREPPEDTEGYQAYIKRMECYKQVISVMDQLYEQRASRAVTPGVPQGPMSPLPVDTTQTSLSEGPDEVKRLVGQALTSSDELMHVAVYEWLVSRQQTSELLLVSQPSLEMYLVRAADQSPDVSDLLWKYYEHNLNHAAAAKVLHKLATRHGSSVTLLQRRDYLARAVICMRSDQVGYAPQLGVFLRELEDMIDVARIQQQVLEDLTKLKGRHRMAEDAITRLNSSLLEITQLYEEFAEPFGLWECKLAIIHCSGHYDVALVETIWRHIMETELRMCGSVGPDDKMAVLMGKVKALGEELIAANERAWLTEGNEFHLVEALAQLVDSFTNNPQLVSSVDRRATTAKAVDVISNCLAVLYSKPDTADLIQRLRGIQAKLNRLAP
ncbi:Nuclear pore complex protein 155 [Blattella germanica]|nr:Nuclear pore complex protein 155 [Blattella germanica]